MQRLATAQPPNEGSSEETTYHKYRLDKYEDTLDNLIKSFDDDEEVQGKAQDINSPMELLVACGKLEVVGSSHSTLLDPYEEEAHMRDLYSDSEFLDDVNRLEPLDRRELSKLG